MNKNKVFSPLLVVMLTLSGCTSWVNQHKYQKFAKLSQLFTDPKTITQDNEQSIFDSFHAIQSAKTQLLHKSNFNQKEAVFYTNIANLHAAYAEYLSKQNCPALSQIQSQQAEQAYLKLLQTNSGEHDNLLYNLALFYAHQSTFERDNPHSTLKINNLKQAQHYANLLQEQNSPTLKYRQVYYDILSELQMTFSKENIEPAQQLEIAKILQEPLNDYLEHYEEVYEGGNFLVLV